MAESYRGLTIQIGGDTTKLTKALHTANQAVSSTQSGLKKLSDALKMDPSSLRASQLQVGAFAEQASNAATRLTTLNQAMRQVSENVRTFHGSTATIKEMADSWGNVSMKAAQARDYYAELTRTIATNYTELSKLNKEAAAAARQEFKSGFDIDETSFESMTQLLSLVDGSKAGLRAQLDTLKELQGKYVELKNSYEEYQHVVATESDQKKFVEAAQKLAQLKTQIEQIKTAFAEAAKELKDVKFKGIDFTFDKKNVDLESLKAGLQQVVAAGKLTQEEADKMYDKFASLKEMFKEAWGNVQTANEVEGFKDLEAETARAEARVKSLVDEIVKLAQTTETSRGLVTLQQQLDNLSKKSDEAKNHLSSTLSAIAESMARNDGNADSGLVNNAMQEYATLVDTVKSKIANLQEQITHYTDEGVIALAHSTESLASDTDAATEKYREAEEVVVGYQAGLDDLQIKMDKIAASDPIGNNDTAAIERYKEYYKQWFDIRSVMEQAKESASKAHAEMTRFVDATNLREKEQQLAGLEDELDKISKINIKPKIDLSALDGINKLIDAISKDIDLSGMHKFREEVDKAATTLSAAEQRYKQLSDAVKIDPTNTETIRQRTAAFDQVIEATTKHIEAMKAELAAIPADRIDSASLAAGTAQQKLQEARQQIENYKTAIIDLNKRIDDLTKEKKEISQVKDVDIERVNKLSKSIEELKSRRAALAAAGDAAFDTYIVAAHTAQVEKDTAAIQQDEAALHKYAIEKEKAGQIEMPTPKIDEAAFMQVVDRISQGVRQMAQEVVQSANEIDSAFRNMTKTVNGTDAQFEELKNAAVEFSQTHVTSADTMLEMQALGGQLGVVAENLEQFGKIGSNLDIATDMDAEDIALRLGQISNVLQLDIDGMQGFSDALVRLGNNMPAQESSIMAVAQRFAAVASTANFSGEEVLAWSASIAATGQRSEAAATAISNTVSGIEQAIANGGSTLEQFAAISGMSSEEFVNSWKTGPTEALKSFINGLQTLNDADESAVAALENMGITGVRQQQTLLALSRTIDNLDDALAMSSNAWHQVSDQWGQAGDAAIEADKKSQGFSGALAIMQNNAQNLAASLGDGLIPFMNAASKVMEFMTDVLSNMSPFAKSALVFLAGTTAAFSTLNPMLTVFSKGIAGTLAAIKQSTSIVELIANLTGLEGALMGAAEQGVNLVGVFSKFAPMAIGISAVAIALGVAMNAINEYNEKQELLRQATDGMTEAAQRAREAYESYSGGTSSAITSLEDLRAKTNEVVESQASLADSMGAKWAEVGESAGSVDYFAQKIVELSEQGELTLAQQSELNAAVEAFNDITGSGIEILDKNTGKLSESADAISKTAEAWKQLAISEAAYEMYKDVVKQRIKDQMALDEVTNSMIETQKNWAEWEGKSVDEVDILTHATKEQREAYETLTESIESADKTMDQYLHYMTATDQVTTAMREALVNAGEDVELFDSLNKEELAQLVAVWDGSVDEIVKAMSRISDQRRNAAKATSDELDEVSKAAAKARAEAYKTEATDEYNARKAELDKEYNDAKRSYDAQYNALKKSLDSEYDEKKRQLDKQYDVRKRALDKEYDAQKQAYDKQHDALKRQLDRQYDAQKLNLDHELDALKKSNDAKLRALKRRFDNEEDAYKDATEHQVKELERKHKLEIRAIEDERDAKVKAIDEEIRALEALNDAEQHEVDKTKQDDKIAELQKKVNDAKSRRKKAEAEKKLNEYIQEVEVKRRKWERDAQIEDLKLKKETIKEEADARKDAANDAYDIEKENFKNSREEQLELLKQANDDRYNAMKLALEAEEQAKKEANDLALENIKYNHQDQLQELKDHNDAQLAALKEKNELELQSIKDNNDMILQSMKDAHSAQLDEMKNNQSIALENMKAAQTKELQDLKASQDAMYKAIKDGGSAMAEATREKYENIKTNFSNKVTEMLNFGRKSFGEFPKVAQTEGDNTEKTFTEKLTTLKTNASRLFNDTSNAAHTELGRMVPDSNWVANGVKDSLIEGIRGAAIGVGNEARQLTQDAKTEFDNMPTDAEKSAENVGSSIEGGINRSAYLAVNEAVRVASDIASNFNFDSVGSDAGDGMISNFNSSMVTRWYDTLLPNIRNMAQTIVNYLGHSVPKKGPLSDDDEWGGHFVENIVDGMHSKEKELYRQVERMADAIEEGFDPTLSVDAAFEALDTIGKNRGKSLEVLADSKSAPVVNVTLNMNLSGVSIREDADIERLAKAMSQEMAAQAARQIAGRLG